MTNERLPLVLGSSYSDLSSNMSRARTSMYMYICEDSSMITRQLPGVLEEVAKFLV